MAVRKDQAQLIITVDAKESAAYQKTLQNNKQLLNNLKKLEVGQEGFNDTLRDMVQVSEKLKNTDFSKLSIKQLTDRRRQLMQLRNILPQVTFAESGFEKELLKVNDALGDARRRVSRYNKGMNTLGAITQRILPTMIAFFAVDRIKAFFTAFTTGTAELDQIERRFTTVFGDAGDLVEGWAEQTAIALGLTESAYKKVTAAAGDLLVPIGFQRRDAALLSKQVVEVSSALAIWEGGTRSTEEITRILNKALLGEREQLKELGVAIQEADVKQRLAAKGQENLTGNALKQAKALATLELITEKSGDAIDSFNKNQDSASRVIARTKATLSQQYEELQQRLLPVFSKFLVFLERGVSVGIAFVKGLAAIPQFIRENKVELAALAIALVSFNAGMIAAAAASIKLSAVQKAQVVWTKAVAVAQKALNLVLKANPIGLVISAVALLVGGFTTLYKRSETVRAGIAGLGNLAVEVFRIIKESVQAFVNGWNELKDGNVGAALKSFGEGLRKSNPVTIAFTEGGRLGAAFAKGYNDKVKEEVEDATIEPVEVKAPVNVTPEVSTEVPDIDINLGDQAPGKGTASKASTRKPGTSPFKTRGQLDGLVELQKRVDEELRILEEAAEEELNIARRKYEAGEEQEETYQINRLRILEENINERLQFLKDLNLTETDLYQELEDEKLSIIQERKEREIDLQLQLIEEGADRELEEAERKFLQRMLTEQQYEDERLRIEEEALQNRLDYLQEAGLEETEIFRQTQLEQLRIQKEINEQKKSDAERDMELRKALILEGLSFSENALGFAIDLLGEEEEARKKNASAIKAFETGRVIANTAVEISEIYKTYTAALGPLGQILAIAKAAAAALRGAQAVKRISGQKFESGDILRLATGDLISGTIFRGPDHSRGGVKFKVGDQIHEAEGGEAIINKRSTTIFKPVLSAINSFRGYGKKFQAGDVIGSTAPTGIDPTPAADESVEVLQDLKRVIEELPARLDGIEARMEYGKIQEADSTVSTLERLSQF
jgi:hypothetical protein